MTIKTPRILIEVAGGVVTAVFSDIPLGVDILDHDDWESTDDPDAADRYEQLEAATHELTEVY